MSIEKKRIQIAIQRFLTPKSRYVRKVINGHSMILDTNDIWMRENLLWCDIYEPETSKFIQENVKRWDVVLDIGAHIGYHSLNFSSSRNRKTFWISNVYAFEPDPFTYQLLCENVKDCRVSPLQVAVSDKEGDAILYRSRNKSAWTSLFPRRNTEPYSVRTITIDNLGLKKIDWVKIDVEGAELQVLRGMKKTLQRSPNPRIIVEWLPKNDGDFDAILKFLQGWKCKPLDHNMLFWRERK